uniref:Uncharacterized protein n=1 Tax=Anguilla anguilla TaxID=7936 RepID=A0A0E9QQE9_ANGAN
MALIMVTEVPSATFSLTSAWYSF